jgi:hypothetical protein
MLRAVRPLNFNSHEFHPGMSYGDLTNDHKATSEMSWKGHNFRYAFTTQPVEQQHYNGDSVFDANLQPFLLSPPRTNDTIPRFFIPPAHDLQLGSEAFPPLPASNPLQHGHNGQSSLLSHFRATMKTKRYELRDIYDHVVEFSSDQHGSRFIQTRLETANPEERERIFSEIRPYLTLLMTDVFGNYVIQKFFEYGSLSHKDILAATMQGQVVLLSCQP